MNSMSKLPATPEAFIRKYQAFDGRLAAAAIRSNNSTSSWRAEATAACRAAEQLDSEAPQISDRDYDEDEAMRIIESLVREISKIAADRNPEYLDAERKSERNHGGMAADLRRSAILMPND